MGKRSRAGLISIFFLCIAKENEQDQIIIPFEIKRVFDHGRLISTGLYCVNIAKKFNNPNIKKFKPVQAIHSTIQATK